jgi:hypothetical protein
VHDEVSLLSYAQATVQVFRQTTRSISSLEGHITDCLFFAAMYCRNDPEVMALVGDVMGGMMGGGGAGGNPLAAMMGQMGGAAPAGGAPQAPPDVEDMGEIN